MTKQFGFLVFQPEKKLEVFQQFFPSAGVLHRAHSLKEFDRESNTQHCVLAMRASMGNLQDPKMEVHLYHMYHIRSYLVGIFPEI